MAQVTVDDEELALIQKHRAEKQALADKRALIRATLLCTANWVKYRDDNGAGLTFSTFTSENEFDASQYIDKVDPELDRRIVFELMQRMLRAIEGFII